MKQMILIFPVFLPILYGVLILLFQGKNQEYHPWLTEAVVIVNSILVWTILLCGAGREGFVLFRLTDDLKVFFRLDGAGMVFSGLVSFLWPLANLYAIEYMEDASSKNSFFSLYTISYGVTLGIALAGNLVTLYVFYEFLTIATFPLVLHYRTRESRRAAQIYLYYSIGGAACAFMSLVFIQNFGFTTDFTLGGVLSTGSQLVSSNGIHMNTSILLAMFVLGFFGFGVKAAVFPMHRWLPIASVAPTPVTALLHAVAVVKSGAFAIIRLIYFTYGADFIRGTWAHYIVAGAAMFTICYASTMAVREIHFKRRLAYSTISNLSYIVMGACMMCRAGLIAALTHLVFHAIMKICAFFCAGAVMHKARRNYVYELDGLGYQMPVIFGCFTVAGLSLTGIPLFAGFISKWEIFQAASAQGGGLGIAAFGVLLYSALMTGIYTMTVVVRAFFPRKDSVWFHNNQAEGSAICDPTWKMLLPIGIFAVLLVFLGLHSKPLIDFYKLIAEGGI